MYVVLLTSLLDAIRGLLNNFYIIFLLGYKGTGLGREIKPWAFLTSKGIHDHVLISLVASLICKKMYWSALEREFTLVMNNSFLAGWNHFMRLLVAAHNIKSMESWNFWYNTGNDKNCKNVLRLSEMKVRDERKWWNALFLFPPNEDFFPQIVNISMQL